jgi:hypothetical protein
MPLARGLPALGQSSLGETGAAQALNQAPLVRRATDPGSGMRHAAAMASVLPWCVLRAKHLSAMAVRSVDRCNEGTNNVTISVALEAPVAPAGSGVIVHIHHSHTCNETIHIDDAADCRWARDCLPGGRPAGE